MVKSLARRVSIIETVLERAEGVEPSTPPWQGGTLPLRQARHLYVVVASSRSRRSIWQDSCTSAMEMPSLPARKSYELCVGMRSEVIQRLSLDSWMAQSAAIIFCSPP